MTPEEHARAMIDVLARHQRARSQPSTSWEKLTEHKRAALVRVAERLQREYDDGNPPSYGLPADESAGVPR